MSFFYSSIKSWNVPTVCVCAFIMGTHHALKETEMNDRIKTTCRALYTDRVAYYDRIGKGKKKNMSLCIICSLQREHWAQQLQRRRRRRRRRRKAKKISKDLKMSFKNCLILRPHLHIDWVKSFLFDREKKRGVRLLRFFFFLFL